MRKFITKRNIILFFILILAIFLRSWNLGNVPPSASLDETSIGWNAYSILSTGRDEYGYKFPILLRAYDDWRPALYVYLVAPFVKIFSLNVLAVRIPSVILTTLSVYVSYFLVLLLFEKYKYKAQLGLLSSFFFAISPWSVYISRLGHEVNAAFAFGISAIFFFLKFINTTNKIYIYLSSLFFVLSFYAYQAQKVFVPLVIILLLILFHKELLEKKKHVLLALVLGIIILIPVLQQTLSSNGLIRFKGTSAFSFNQPVYIQAAKDRLYAKENGDLLKEILNNSRIISFEIFFQNYISHFNPVWLFENNNMGDFKAPGMGLLYSWSFPFIILGIFFLFSSKFERRTKIIIAGWILISPVAASIATGAPHAMRSYSLLPIPEILASFGLIALFSLIKKPLTKKIFILVVAIVIVYFGFFFFNKYFYVFPREQSKSFQFALSQAIHFVNLNKDKYNKIVFSNRDNLHQSYMFYLFYTKYDPRDYQEQGGTKSGGFAETHRIGKYEFRPIVWENEIRNKKTLYIGNPSDFPQDVNPITEIKNLDGKVVVKIVSKNE